MLPRPCGILLRQNASVSRKREQAPALHRDVLPANWVRRIGSALRSRRRKSKERARTAFDPAQDEPALRKAGTILRRGWALRQRAQEAAPLRDIARQRASVSKSGSKLRRHGILLGQQASVSRKREQAPALHRNVPAPSWVRRRAVACRLFVAEGFDGVDAHGAAGGEVAGQERDGDEGASG